MRQRTLDSLASFERNGEREYSNDAFVHQGCKPCFGQWWFCFVQLAPLLLKMSEPLASWITLRQLFSATFDECTVGVKAKDDQPARKPWRFVTNNVRLAESLGKLECTHDRRAPLQRKYTRNSAFYPDPLCRLMLSALFRHLINGQVPTTPNVSTCSERHAMCSHCCHDA